MELLCPICGELLSKQDKSYRCPEGHSFDIARQGHVNLLPVQNKRSLNPGDTAQQVAGRRAFLDGGFYAPIRDALCALATDHGCCGPILDIGCGEGYYSAGLAKVLGAELLGLDISKEAVRYAAGRYKEATWICASAAHLPVKDQSFGLITSLFALTMPEEFKRVLRTDGAYIQVLAAEDHLMGLKNIIYPELHHKEKFSTPEIPGFRLAESRALRFSFTAEGVQVQNLLGMTPHVYRISKEGADRLRQTQTLTDTASCVLNLYLPE